MMSTISTQRNTQSPLDSTQLNTIAFADDDLVEIRFSKAISKRKEILKLLEGLPEAEGFYYYKTYSNIIGVRCNPQVWLNYLQQTATGEAIESFKKALETAKALYTTEVTTQNV